MNLARHLDSQVLPTPDGPRNTNEPIGRFGSFRPARVRRTAFAIAVIARSWLMTSLPSSFSMLIRRSASAWSRRFSGMPVILETVSAITSSSTIPPDSREFSRSRHSRWISSFFLPSLNDWSRRSAARSKSWPATASSFSLLRRAISVSMSRRSGGAVIDLMRTRAPASSMTSIALSGRKRPVM